jgi:hypothetical protein
MKAQNEKEFNALIKKYESISLSELDDESDPDDYETAQILYRMTGFGDWSKCSLCKSFIIDEMVHCDNCVWFSSYKKKFACAKGKNSSTYLALENAEKIIDLYKGIKLRAKRMKIVLEQYQKQLKP